jgi:hypothetical protein
MTQPQDIRVGAGCETFTLLLFCGRVYTLNDRRLSAHFASTLTTVIPNAVCGMRQVLHRASSDDSPLGSRRRTLRNSFLLAVPSFLPSLCDIP